jgi:hypothetical protein
MVKYDTLNSKQRKLDMHTDKSKWTFLVALTDGRGRGQDYVGRGTFFQALDSTLFWRPAAQSMGQPAASSFEQPATRSAEQPAARSVRCPGALSFGRPGAQAPRLLGGRVP